MTDPIIIHSEEAAGDPKLKEFSDRALKKDIGELNFDDIEGDDYINFWPRFVIGEYVAEKQNYLYRFWGTDIAQAYGVDLTGKYIDEVGFPEGVEEIRVLYERVINDLEVLYSSGRVLYDEKKYTHWNRVALPLRNRDGRVFSLSYTVFFRG